ncbi:MAG: EF-hand domain-containing protein [Methylocystis sp.]
MSKISKIAIISGLAAAAIASTSALAVSKRTWAAGSRDVQNLIRLMDQDKNGVVSKEEFMQFMEAEFDRLDVDKSGGLTPQELSRSSIYGGGTHTNPHR